MIFDEKKVTVFDGNSRFHGWHVEQTYPTISTGICIKELNGLCFKDMPSGCGCITMYNWRNITITESFIKTFEEYCKMFKEDGVGSIITTCGEAYYSFLPDLKKLGFVNIIEYNNYRHNPNGGYKQSLLIKTL